MPTKSAPKAKLPPAPKNPNMGITSINKPDDGSESEIAKRLKSDRLTPAKSGVATTADVRLADREVQKNNDKTDQKIAQQTAQATKTQTALQQATGQPWKGSDKWKEPAKDKKKKPDEEGTGRREPKDKPSKPPRKPFALPAFDVGATALASMTPGAKLNISGPRREGGADAIRSRMSAIERNALKAQ
jgi:hypothetical protein